ncbi:MAG: glycosyltransferase [Lachnospiraceae bacterium]|nr:glycosyltransferase [Lachnospiraceae bacterium]
MGKIRASVLFVLYENFDEAEITLRSLAEQQCRDVELILSDDGSAGYDTSLLEKEAERLKGTFAEVRVNVNEKNMGSVAHFNRLFGIAKGEYIVFCSPGDRFPTPHTVERIVSRMERGKETVLTGRRRDMYADHSKVRPSLLVGAALRICPRLLMNYMIRRRNLISSCCTAYSKRLFERCGMPDEGYRLLDDFPYIITLLQKGERIGFTREIFLEHSIGGGVSTGESIHPLILKDLIRMQEQLAAHPEGLYASTRRYLEREIAKRRTEDGRG